MERPVADTTTDDPRAVLAGANTTPLPEEKAGKRLLLAASWFVLLAFSAAATVPMLGLAWQNVASWSLVNASPAETRAALLADWSGSSSPDYLEAVAELSLQQPTVDEASAFVAARRATQLDPSRAFAWAMLAYLETRQLNGRVDNVAREALTKSMDACPLCDADLIRWRFNYVLTNWSEMPETIRSRAFEQADLLRWIGPNAEFLAEMRFKAGLNGIPFDTYRSRVKTPARAWDIAPSAALRAQSSPARAA